MKLLHLKLHQRLWGVAHTYTTAVDHFSKLQGRLQEGTHKSTPPPTSMVWLGLLFDSMAMTVNFPPEKPKDVLDLDTT